MNAIANFFNVYPVGATFTGHLADTAKKFGLSASTLRKYVDLEYISEETPVEITEEEYTKTYELWDDLEYVHGYSFEEELGYYKKNGKYYMIEFNDCYKVKEKNSKSEKGLKKPLVQLNDYF